MSDIQPRKAYQSIFFAFSQRNVKREPGEGIFLVFLSYKRNRGIFISIFFIHFIVSNSENTEKRIVFSEGTYIEKRVM